MKWPFNIQNKNNLFEKHLNYEKDTILYHQ